MVKREAVLYNVQVNQYRILEKRFPCHPAMEQSLSACTAGEWARWFVDVPERIHFVEDLSEKYETSDR